MIRTQNVNDKPADVFDMNTTVYYSSLTAMLQLMAPTEKQVAFGPINSCREVFCASFKEHAINSSKASARKYAMVLRTAMSARSKTIRINKLKKAIAFINGLEDKFHIDPTRATVYVDENLSFRGTACSNHIVFVVEIDEIWASAPALLSMHTLLMRLPQSTVLPAKTKSFDDLVDLVEKKEMRRTRDGSHFYSVKKWIVLLDNLLEVFGDSTAKESWNYADYKAHHGISQLCNDSGGERKARTKLKDIMKSQLVQ